jgi:hypothetical protein
MHVVIENKLWESWHDSYLGIVTDEFAQWEAARAADIAAERTLQQQSLLSAELCQQFMQEMLKMMGDAIDGTRIIKADLL